MNKAPKAKAGDAWVLNQSFQLTGLGVPACSKKKQQGSPTGSCALAQAATLATWRK
jgi:hypothetical protein